MSSSILSAIHSQAFSPFSFDQLQNAHTLLKMEALKAWDKGTYRLCFDTLAHSGDKITLAFKYFYLGYRSCKICLWWTALVPLWTQYRGTHKLVCLAFMSYISTWQGLNYSSLEAVTKQEDANVCEVVSSQTGPLCFGLLKNLFLAMFLISNRTHYHGNQCSERGLL